jgi:predicted ABC-type ATPase
VTVEPELRRSIFVFAGTNGAGKSSVAGAAFRENGFEYFNPDEATWRLQEANPGISLEVANSKAWLQGTRLLRRAITERMDFAFETTLGGNTIPRLLKDAHAAGLAVRLWFVGLDSPERHIARVRARVAAGGHDIPEARIRERYDRSRENLIHLLPTLTQLRLYDNSEEGDPTANVRPSPKLILHASDGVVRETCAVSTVPDWAKPLFIAALRQYSSRA